MNQARKKYLQDLTAWRAQVEAWYAARVAAALGGGGAQTLDSGNNGPPPPPPAVGDD